ncbi:hypothetical protein B0H34DRAFT_716975 [Crassisporium funariophilum]|nr:hypothetical protein B0H34DRAFT_716975 [Crassisporium funariophilum]
MPHSSSHSSLPPFLPNILINSTYRWYNCCPHKQYKQRVRTRPKKGMLFSDPSSTCDVCFETYTWTTEAVRPYVLKCGHIFCLACLHKIQDHCCPTCRRSISNNEHIRLFADPDANHQREMEHLHQLMQAWPLGAPPEQLEEVLREVDEWLRDRSDDSVSASFSGGREGKADWVGTA